MHMKQVSDKSYAVAVCLSAVFGLIGLQHFYLKRPLAGFIDIALTGGWIYAFMVGKTVIAIVFLAADVVQSIVVTILLLTGSYKDGDGKYVCYPGQELNSN